MNKTCPDCATEYDPGWTINDPIDGVTYLVELAEINPATGSKYDVDTACRNSQSDGGGMTGLKWYPDNIIRHVVLSDVVDRLRDRDERGTG